MYLLRWLIAAVLGLVQISCSQRALKPTGSELIQKYRRDGTVYCPLAGSRPSRRALLVGISHYQRSQVDPQFLDLHAGRDVEGMLELLCNSYDFSAVHVLQDQEATAAQIVAAFERFLIAKSQSGDTAVFYYSGHGQRVRDQDPNEEPDHYDEALVPYDYVTKDPDDNRSRRILDDQLARLLGALQRKIRPDGGNAGSITVLLDTCFAAGMVRGDGPLRARGDSGSWRPGLGDTVAESASGLLPKEEARRRDYVILAAARSDEPAFEEHERSAFTEHLLAALSREPRQTPRMLLTQLTSGLMMQGVAQTPQLEGGAAIDRMLFDSQPGPRVIRAQMRDGAIILQGGQGRNHITEGAVYSLYAAQGKAAELAERVAEAIVTESGILDSKARVTWKRDDKADFDKGLAVLSQHAPQTLVRVAAPLPLLNAIQQQLEAVQGADADHADFVVGEQTGELCLLRGLDRGLIACVARSTDEASAIVELLDRHLLSRFLSQLELTDGLPIQMQLKIVRAALNAQGEIAQPERSIDVAERRMSDGGHLLLRPPGNQEADTIQIELQHNHKNPLYISIFEIYPDMRISQIFPDPAARDSFKPLLRSSGWRVLGDENALYFRRIVNREPDGKLVRGRFLLKLIATTEPMYLTDFSWERRQRKHLSIGGRLAPLNRLELLFGAPVRDGNPKPLTPRHAAFAQTVQAEYCVETCSQ